MSKWISVNDWLPSYGEPVLLVIDGAVQNTTYVLRRGEMVPDWFEFFLTGDGAVWWNEASHWMPPPEAPENE